VALQNILCVVIGQAHTAGLETCKPSTA
jgi:hypothetical protein